MNRRRRSRSRSNERRSSDSHGDSRHHHHGSSSSSRRDRSSPSRKYRSRKSRSRSRSRSRSPQKTNERSKLEMRQQMAKNYEEQMEKMKAQKQFAPVPAPTPKFPNQVPVEPSKLVEQIEKRKFLFSKKPAEETSTSNTVWKNTAFSDSDQTAKFKRLMGIKDKDKSESAVSTAAEKDATTAKKQQEYFENLEKQYEIARTTTHTQRGLGLGFSSGTRLYPVIPQKPSSK